MAKVQVEKITRFKQRVDEVAALDDDHIISADTIRFVYENTFPGSTLHDVVMQEVIELYFLYMYTFMKNAKMARKLLKGIEEAQMDMINHIKVQLSRQNVTQEPRTQPKRGLQRQIVCRSHIGQ